MDSLDQFLDSLSMPWYSSKHPVHGPYNPNKKRTNWLMQADNEADMRYYLEEQERITLMEEEAGGESVSSYDGSAATRRSSSALSDHHVKTKTFNELANMYWDDISDSTWSQD